MKNKDRIEIALLAAFICVCAMITIPVGPVPVTFQSFGVYMALFVLGGKKGTVAIFLYLLLGAMGLPVCSGFRGGFGHFAGPAGGFLFGFLLLALCYQAVVGSFGDRKKIRIFAAVLSHLFLYASGVLWYCLAYGGSLAFALLYLVLLYVPMDGAKLALAFWVSRKLKRHK